MRLTVQVLFALLLAGIDVPTAAQQPTADQRRFGVEMAEQLRRRLPAAKVTVQKDDPLAVLLKGGDWDDATVNFHRIYGYCQTATAKECAATKTEFLDRILKKVPKATPESLRIAVRDSEYVGFVRALPVDDVTKQPSSFIRPIGEDLFAILVNDTPDALSVVMAKDLREIGLTPEQAWTRAWLQTRVKLPDLPTAAQLKDSAVVYQDQEYLASLLADTAGWTRVAAAAGSDLFVTVVADNFVFVGQMQDGAALEKFKTTVREDCAAQQRCVSPNLYRFRDGRWVVAR